MREWLALCFSKSVTGRACLYALVVGAILIAINHGDALLRRDLDGARLFRMALTVQVPYTVSTLSSVSAIRSFQSRKKD